jgi:hypothetical protein
MTPEERITQLEKQLSHLTDIFYRQHSIDKDVFQNPVIFNGNIGFFKKTPAVQQDSTGVTTVAGLITLLKNYGLLK